MDDWIQILSNQWYITLSTHEIIWACCELNRLSRERIKCSHVNLNKVGSGGQYLSMQQKFHWRYAKKSSTVLHKFPPIWISILESINHTCNLWKKISSMLLLIFPDQYISNISNIYNHNVNMSLASKMKCDNMFFRSGIGSYIFKNFS